MGIRIAVDESGEWRSTQTGPDVYPIRNSIETSTPDEPRRRCRCRGELLCPRHFKLLSTEDRKAYKAAHGEPVTAGRPS